MAKMFKKTFAMLMVLCMLVGMLPVQALAEEAEVVAPEATVTLDITSETPTVVVNFTPGEDDPIVPEIESELTTGDGIVAEGEYTMTETTDEEGNSVVIEEVTITTEGKLEDGTAVEGEETYVETTTTTTTETETVSTVKSTLEGQETTTLENGAITPDDTDLPEVEVPALPSDKLFDGEGATKDVVVDKVDPDEVVVEEKDEEGRVHTTITDSCTTTTTTTENVTITEQNKVEEENKSVETNTTTTVEKVTTETVVDELYQYGIGNNLLDQNITQEKDTVVNVTTNVTVTETTKETVGDVQEGEDDIEYDYSDIETTIEREVTTETEVKVEDYSSADMDQVVAPEEYEGKYYDQPGKITGFNQPTGLLNGRNPDYRAPGEKPEEGGYEFVISGEGDATWAAAPVFKNIVYQRDENGNPIPDPENPGSYLIDEEKSTLVYSGSKAGNSGMNATPGMIVVKNEDGEFFYTYCIDKVTMTDEGSWYKITNLEDSDYYPDDESAAMLRAIVTNGYWGTDANVYETDAEGNILVDEEGNKIVKKDENGKIIVDENVKGSLAKIKAMMRAAYDENDTVTVKDAKGKEHTYKIVDLIDDLKEHEALAVTQSAIWSYSNGALATRNGEDGLAVVGVMSSKKFFNGVAQDSPLNQYAPVYNLESDARLQALYDLFMNLEPMKSDPAKVTTVINDSNFVGDVFLTVGDKVEDNAANYDANEKNDVYETELNFTLAFVPNQEDDSLLVYLLDEDGEKITDKDGKPIVKRLAGKNAEGEEYETITPENGVYTLKGLQLSENSDFKFDLKLEGTQLLKEGVYVYTSHGGRTHSQTLVGLAAGTQNVDVSASMTIKFEVDESKSVVATRHWRTESDPRFEEVQEPQDPPTRYRYTPGTVIEEEPVPLAEVPQTGDNSVIWFAMIMLAAAGLFVLNQSEKKCKA